MSQPTRPRRRETRTVLSHPHIEVHEHTLEPESDGGEARRIVTLSLFDWAVVAAVDRDGNFVMIDQHRHGIDAATLECAGGVVDPGEKPDEAARRELLEETGYEATALEPLGWVHPNPALHGNRAYFFLARGVVRRAAPANEAGEETLVRLMSSAQIERAEASGEISHAMSVLALDRARRALAPAIELAQAEALLEAMRDRENDELVELANRLRPGLTVDDLKQPHDFAELDDADYQFQDGQIAGIESALVALRALAKERG